MFTYICIYIYIYASHIHITDVHIYMHKCIVYMGLICLTSLFHGVDGRFGWHIEHDRDILSGRNLDQKKQLQ